MTESVALYLTRQAQISVNDLQRIAHDGAVTVKNYPPLSGHTIYQIAWSDQIIYLAAMPDNQLATHLNGMVSYVLKALSTNPPQTRQAGVKRIQTVKTSLGVVMEPGWDAEGRCKRVILGVAQWGNGFFFAENSFYDAQGELIIGSTQTRKKFFADDVDVTPLALARKARSEAVLQQENVPFFTHLPTITASVEPRTRAEIARRALVLSIVAGYAKGLKQERCFQLLQQYGLEAHLTPAEAAFVHEPVMDELAGINFVWRYESYWTLLWALGYIEQLGQPAHVCDTHRAAAIMLNRSAEQFINEAQLRPIEEILDQADLIYRYHWAVADAWLKRQPPPANLVPEVVYERHYALNWLIRFEAVPWDEVNTPT